GKRIDTTVDQQDPELEGMCTTGVAMVLTREGAFVAHAGDSRGYLVRSEQVYQLTEDHTFANQLIKQGLLKNVAMSDFPYSHVITRSFGAKAEIDVDTIFIEPAPGDRFVLCTDGLHNYIDGDELRVLSGHFAEPEHLAEHLLQEANARGGNDNMTVAVVELRTSSTEDDTAIDLERKLDFMRRLFLFKDLHDEELMRVMQSVYSIRKPKGEYIIHEGATGAEFYIVIEGLVDVMLEGRYLTSIAPGGHFGEMALIGDHFRSASVVAKTDVLLLTIRRDDFLTLIDNEHELVKKLLWAFLENMAGRVRDLSCEIVELNGQLNALKRQR
ncbi:MAG: cyclic nucleotide-binding domain-containing protein, partial [Myxococcota bacterium]